MIFRRTQNVPALNNYEGYRPYLRLDFEHRCAYCLRHEFFFGGGEAGEIDHHRPLHRFPALRNEYGNLYWSCRKCNAVKSGQWPTEGQIRRGLHFLDPCAEDHDDHWKTQADGSLTPTTPVGRYTVRHVRLDRPTLVEFRLFLHGLQERVQALEVSLRAANLSPVTLTRLLAELESATVLLHPPVFSI